MFPLEKSFSPLVESIRLYDMACTLSGSLLNVILKVWLFGTRGEEAIPLGSS